MSLRTRIHPPLPFPLDIVGDYPTSLQEDEVASSSFTYTGTTSEYTLTKSPVETGTFKDARAVFRNGVKVPVGAAVDEGITVTWSANKISINADITNQGDIWMFSYWY